MGCESKPKEHTGFYCDSCHSCHECVEENQERDIVRILRLEAKVLELEDKLDAYITYSGEVDYAQHKSHNSRIEDAKESLMETLKEIGGKYSIE